MQKRQAELVQEVGQILAGIIQEVTQALDGIGADLAGIPIIVSPPARCVSVDSVLIPLRAVSSHPSSPASIPSSSESTLSSLVFSKSSRVS